MGPIKQCIVALGLMSCVFCLVDAQASSAEDARQICEQNIKIYDVYKDQSVANAFTDCMYEHLGKYHQEIFNTEKDLD